MPADVAKKCKTVNEIRQSIEHDAKFPDWTTVVPNYMKTKNIVVQRAELLDAVKSLLETVKKENQAAHLFRKMNKYEVWANNAKRELAVLRGTRQPKMSYIIAWEEPMFSIKLVFGKDFVELSTRHLHFLNSDPHEEGIKGEPVRGTHRKAEEITVAINPEYLLEAVKMFDEEELRIQCTNDYSPIVIRPVSPEKLDGLTAVMPMRKW